MFRIPISNQWRKKKMEPKVAWSRRKTFVLYMLSMPLIAALFVYWNMNQNTTVGTVSLLIGAIILFEEVETYLREVLQRRKGGK